jgi:hypothetical protein
LISPNNLCTPLSTSQKLTQQDIHPAPKTAHVPGMSGLDSLSVAGLCSNRSDEEAVAENLDYARELAKTDQGKDVSASGQHGQADAE